ncbi:MAG: glycosyltransferase, partial [Planctomycetota bacterium]
MRCGAVLVMERDNLEVRDFFVPNEECVLYDDADFEHVIADLLCFPVRIARIARVSGVSGVKYRAAPKHRLIPKH